MLVGAELRRSTARAVRIASSVMMVVASTVTITVLAGAETASAAFACSPGGPTYSVRSGDGWYSIAERVDVDTRLLLEANGAGLDDLLVPGDRLCLPAGADLIAACGASYTVESGDGWYSIADRLGVSSTSLLAVNGASADDMIVPGQTLCAPDDAAIDPSSSSSSSGSSSGPSSGPSYTVSSGDSWFGIAGRADVSLSALLGANGADADDVIVPGQLIRLPAGATEPASAPAQQWVELDALPTQGPCWFGDTWGDGRSGGRRHVGVDIFTVPGQYVYAVADGRLTTRFWDQPGRISGNAWMLTAANGDQFFYAHLSDFAVEVSLGSWVEAGQIIGWVGSTGNSSSPHLHFEIRPGGGEPINPYPIVRAQGGCNDGTPYTQPGGWVPD